jgi:hypothetical protein
MKYAGHSEDDMKEMSSSWKRIGRRRALTAYQERHISADVDAGSPIRTRAKT